MAYIDTYKKGKVTGTAESDEINVSGYTIVDKNGNEKPDVNKKFKGMTINAKGGDDFITATKYIDTINCGDGDDTVYSTLGNDKITGGKGQNTLIYSGSFDKDTITLTKGENLKIDLQNYGLNGKDDLDFKVSGNHLIITVKEYGTITLKNFAKSNVTGADGSVNITFSNDNTLNLNQDNYLSYIAKDFNSKGGFTGSRFNESIDASLLQHNATISAKGGYNIIKSTVGYTDKITGGNDGNEIYTYDGNKTVTTGSGDDIIKVYGSNTNKITAGNGENEVSLYGSGTNTVKTGKDKDTFNIEGHTISTIYAGGEVNTFNINNTGGDFGAITLKEQNLNAAQKIVFSEKIDSDYVFSKSGNNLVLRNTESGSYLILEKYFTTGKKHSQYEFYIGDTKYTDLNDIVNLTKGFEINGKGTIKGTEYNDVIIADDTTGSKISNDTILAGKGKDSINAGAGNNKIIFHSGDGQDTVVKGNGTDTLVFDEGTKLDFSFNNDDMIITYGENDSVIIDNYLKGTSVKYIQVGNTINELNKYYDILSRNGHSKYINLSKNTDTELILTNTFSGKDLKYSLTSLKEGETVKLTYLENGRLVVEGNYIQVTAAEGQEDDIILLGNHNKIITGDENDIVRVGTALDSSINFQSMSSYNTIITGDGNDYVTYFGGRNDMDMGDGYDKVQRAFILSSDSTSDYCTITNCEEFRGIQDNSTTTDGQIGWYNQGDLGGDCRLFAILESLSKSKDFNSISNYVTITQVDDENYSVKFNNYDGNNTTNVALSELKTIGYDGSGNPVELSFVNGDLDVVLIDMALNKLLNENSAYDKALLESTFNPTSPIKTTTAVKTTYYNTLSNYIYGSLDITCVNYGTDFKEKLFELWTAYKNGEISNITIGTARADQSGTELDRLGIVPSHAYTIDNLTETTISLVNVWDSADILNLDLEKFYSINPDIVIYDTAYYGERLLMGQGTAQSNQYLYYDESDLSAVVSETLSWNTNSQTDIIIANTNNEVPDLTLTFTDTPSDNLCP